MAGGPRSLSGPGWRRFPVQRGWRAGGPERRRRPLTDNESGGALLSGGGESDAGPGAGRAPVMDNQVRSLRPGLASRCPAWRCGRPYAHTAPRAPGVRAPIRMGPSPATATPGRPSPHRHLRMPLPHCDPPKHPSPNGDPNPLGLSQHPSATHFTLGILRHRSVSTPPGHLRGHSLGQSPVRHPLESQSILWALFRNPGLQHLRNSISFQRSLEAPSLHRLLRCLSGSQGFSTLGITVPLGFPLEPWY